MKKTIIATALALALAAPAFAFDTVIDPWNLARNVEQITNQARQLQEMVQMVQNGIDLKQLAQFANEKILIDLVEVHKQAGTLSQLQEQIVNVLGAHAAASSSVRSVMDIYNQGAEPGESFQQFYERQSRVHSAVGQRANAAYEHAMSTQAGLRAQTNKLQQLHQDAQNAVGTDQLLQTANAHLNIIAQQQAQIISLTSEANAQSYERRQLEEKEKKQELDRKSAWRAAREQAAKQWGGQ